LISKKSSSLKPLGLMNQNLAFGQAVSEETFFFLEINQSETRIACGGHVC
jgi:hypothetical protein